MGMKTKKTTRTTRKKRVATNAKRETRINSRTGLDVESIKRGMLNNLFFDRGRFPKVATMNDYYLSLAHTIRDRLQRNWINTAETYMKKRSRTVCYLSAEYLLGPHLENNILNLNIHERTKKAVEESGLDLHALLHKEEEPGLGNGGLGRLAACFMDSLATIEVPAIGYGIRYEFGIFDQVIKDGWQVEMTDKWLHMGNPWEIQQPEISFEVKFGGHTETYYDEQNRYRVRWVPAHVVKGIPYDTPIQGYRVNTANLLRLWSAEACESFDFSAFNVGDYYGAVHAKMMSENITKVLYPNDDQQAGKLLRLQQQYFFASCSLQDMIRIFLQTSTNLENFHRKYAVQLNDTHPAIAVAELMRLLLDVHGMDWERAWHVTRNTFGYTNHTLLPEALEKWAVPLFGSLLPRLLEIIYEINSRFLDDVRAQYPGDDERARRMSLIDESGCKYIRMAHLACAGSRSINGVSKLHADLLRKVVLKDFSDMWPDKFSNKTNGVTPRRFVLLSNPRLTRLISGAIGDKWISDFRAISKLTRFSKDGGFLEKWREVKSANKHDLATIIMERTGVLVDPGSLFDIQVKRIHEYKRQHLNVLHIITLYNRIRNHPGVEAAPRTFIFGGKAAPGYHIAKLIIKLINSVANVVNKDPATRDMLKVVFFPDFNVMNAQHICPAADLSEQISTAGKEASGTGNMKFMMNGALTIGTLDGANVEIREEAGADNFFLFGLNVDEVHEKASCGYEPMEIYSANAELRQAVDMIASGYFSQGDRDLFRPLVDSMLRIDRYMVLADYQAYIECQEKVSATYLAPERWSRMALLNTARSGKFSSDRTIREYCRDIWKTRPVHISMHN